MIVRMLVAAALAGLAAPLAAPAHAGPRQVGCEFHAVAQQQVTGSTYEGAAYGYAVADASDDVALSCVLYVNGTEVTSTPDGSGRGAAVTAGRVTFAASETDSVALCERVTVNGATTTYCGDIGPWPDVWWLVDHVWPDWTVLDRTVCPVLAGLAGTYGPVTVNGQGDVYAGGEPQWDCPPYDIWSRP